MPGWRGTPDEHASKGQVKSLVAVIHSGEVPKQLRDNLVETAFLVESHELRMVQVVDLLCHTLYRFLTAADDRFFHIIDWPDSYRSRTALSLPRRACRWGPS